MKKYWLILLGVLTGFCHAGELRCDFWHNKHVQGVVYGEQALYWCFTDVIVKTDMTGKVLRRADLHRMPGRAHHGGDPCFENGKLFIPYSGSGFNRPLGKRKNSNYIQIYDADLNFLRAYPVFELEYGAGCIASLNGRFFVSGGRPATLPGNTVWEYDRDFKLVEKHELSFSSPKGIQALNFDGKYWCFGIYNNPAMTVVADKNFQLLGKRNFNSAVGLVTIHGQGVFRVRSIRKNADGKKLYSGGLLKIPEERLIIGEMSEKMLVKP